MSEKIQIKPFVSDLIALEMETASQIGRQIEDNEVMRFPEACNFLVDARRTINDQVLMLRKHLDDIGGEPSTGLKSTISEVVGTAVTMLQSNRKTAVSQYLKDDHAALSTLCLSYEVLHTTALSTHDYSTAALALRQLENLASISMECGKTIPSVVIKELVEQDESLDGSVVDEAEHNIRRAWQLGVRLEYQKDNHKQFAASV